MISRSFWRSHDFSNVEGRPRLTLDSLALFAFRILSSSIHCKLKSILPTSKLEFYNKKHSILNDLYKIDQFIAFYNASKAAGAKCLTGDSNVIYELYLTDLVAASKKSVIKLTQKEKTMVNAFLSTPTYEEYYYESPGWKKKIGNAFSPTMLSFLQLDQLYDRKRNKSMSKVSSLSQSSDKVMEDLLKVDQFINKKQDERQKREQAKKNEEHNRILINDLFETDRLIDTMKRKRTLSASNSNDAVAAKKKNRRSIFTTAEKIMTFKRFVESPTAANQNASSSRQEKKKHDTAIKALLDTDNEVDWLRSGRTKNMGDTNSRKVQQQLSEKQHNLSRMKKIEMKRRNLASRSDENIIKVIPPIYVAPPPSKISSVQASNSKGKNGSYYDVLVDSSSISSNSTTTTSTSTVAVQNPSPLSSPAKLPPKVPPPRPPARRSIFSTYEKSRALASHKDL